MEKLCQSTRFKLDIYHLCFFFLIYVQIIILIINAGAHKHKKLTALLHIQ